MIKLRILKKNKEFPKLFSNLSYLKYLFIYFILFGS